ncbi:MAG: DUF3467 domain-containing protein [bacterium]
MEEKKIPIEMEAAIAGGVYSNLTIISHSDNEFIFDFILAHPPKGKVNARVILSPSHAKRLMTALQNNVALFEKKFGPIKAATEPPQIGIQFSNN